jgi:hypothetical protein
MNVNGSRRTLLLASDPGKFLSTVQIGITLVGELSGARGDYWPALGELADGFRNVRERCGRDWHRRSRERLGAITFTTNIANLIFGTHGRSKYPDIPTIYRQLSFNAAVTHWPPPPCFQKRPASFPAVLCVPKTLSTLMR